MKAKKAKKAKKILHQRFTFTPEEIDKAAVFVRLATENFGISKKTALRLQLSVEEVLLTWKETPGMAEEYTIEITSRWRRVNLSLRAEGISCNPMSVEADEEYGSGALGRTLLENLGMTLFWQYQNGCNVVSCSLTKEQKLSQLSQVLFTAVLALIVGTAAMFLPAIWGDTLLNTLVDPLFHTFLGMFSCIVGPLMFLSMIWGIVNIGDAKLLGTIGKKLILRFIAISTVFSAVCMGGALLVFQPQFSGGQSSMAVLQSVVEMILDIIPGNAVEPFVNGNTLQILFMSVVIGVVIILLKDRMQEMITIVEQSNAIVQLILGAVSSMIPFFIFLSVLRLMLQGTLTESAAGLLRAILLCVCLSAVEIIAETLSLIKQGISPLKAIKLYGTAFFVALTTASSAATIPVMMDTCRKKLGVDEKFANFSLPFGSVVFMPHAANLFVVVPLFAACIYEVELTVGSVILCILNAVILSIAAPPIPGGALSCYTLMFLQLGIPLEAVSLAAAANIVLDFTATCGNCHALMVQVTHAAKKLDMMDGEVLRRSLDT
ncbi:MAG: cation:dicarboxylase symporter family transporter [Clostridia bacterium]|nr:cation:dicarboxylase symporter family transporter [Clostridia bacterium]